jgi:CheY-like chemotaxis protein
MYVLFVGDHVACADMFADIAEGLGHRACVAHDGVSALLHYSEETFDLILLDISKIVTDQLRSYPAARAEIPELEHFKHVFVRASARLNNRAENSHQPTHASAASTTGTSFGACVAFAIRNAPKCSCLASADQAALCTQATFASRFALS